MGNLDLFTKYLTEAPGDDEAPDAGMGDESSPPNSNNAESDEMPNIGDDAGNIIPDEEGGGDDTPPDIDDINGDEGFDDGEDEYIGDGENPNPDESLENLGLDDKVSTIMNMNLYQRFLTLLNTIASQTSMVKDNSDILQTLSPEALSIIDSLKKLDENIRLYLKNTFLNENYSKNILFFNKCINLLKILNDIFEKNINDGIASVR